HQGANPGPIGAVYVGALAGLLRTLQYRLFPLLDLSLSTWHFLSLLMSAAQTINFKRASKPCQTRPLLQLRVFAGVVPKLIRLAVVIAGSTYLLLRDIHGSD